MLNKYSTLILGAMLGIGTLAFSGAGASAMLPLAPVSSGEANGPNDGIMQVKHNNNGPSYGMNWNKRRFNNRCSYNYGGCRHYRRNNHFNSSYLYLPLIIGGLGSYNYYDRGYGNGYGYAGVSSRHVRWCLNRYRSYNPRTNLWVAYSGRRHQCNSPYY